MIVNGKRKTFDRDSCPSADDDSELVEAISNLLDAKGYDVHTASLRLHLLSRWRVRPQRGCRGTWLAKVIVSSTLQDGRCGQSLFEPEFDLRANENTVTDTGSNVVVSVSPATLTQPTLSHVGFLSVGAVPR